MSNKKPNEAVPWAAPEGERCGAERPSTGMPCVRHRGHVGHHMTLRGRGFDLPPAVEPEQNFGPCEGMCAPPDDCSRCKVGRFAPAVEPEQPILDYDCDVCGLIQHECVHLRDFREAMEGKTTKPVAACPECFNSGHTLGTLEGAADERARIERTIEAMRCGLIPPRNSTQRSMLADLNDLLAAIRGGDDA